MWHHRNHRQYQEEADGEVHDERPRERVTRSGYAGTRDRAKGSLTISQESSTESVLDRFGMGNCKPVSTQGHGSEL